MVIDIIENNKEGFKVEIIANPFYIDKEDVEEFTEKLEILIDQYKKARA